ncbi:MAG: DNA polymerase III subunit beta [Sulfurimonas sp.]|nr:DNA polymerase III subunit beta [Sulfurimonas sp.]
MLLMEITRDSLLKPLQSVIGIVERRHTLPILSNLYVEQSSNQLTLLATDLEIQISTKITYENANQDFAITVSAKKLQDICRAFTEETIISFEREESKIQVKAGKSRFSLQTLPAEDFPRLSVASDYYNKIRVSEKILKGLLNRVQYAMAQQDIRYYLNGLLFIAEPGSIKLVATDGHRLAMVGERLDGEENILPQEVILPRKSVVELIKLLNDSDEDVLIEFAPNQVKFSFSEVVMITKIVEGKFPDFNKVIPINYQNSFTLERLTLLHALQRASILSSEKFSGVRLVLTQNSIRILCSNNEQEEAQEELEIEYNGTPLDIGFNVRYLLDVLNNLNEGEITCSFGDVNSSALITLPNNDDFKYVVMPMRI